MCLNEWYSIISLVNTYCMAIILFYTITDGYTDIQYYMLYVYCILSLCTVYIILYMVYYTSTVCQYYIINTLLENEVIGIP